MLDKLKRNKNLVIVFFLTLGLVSCTLKVKRPPLKVKVNTEIVCSNGDRILIKFARVSDVRIAIEKYSLEKKKNNITGNYTVIKLLDGRSLKIEGMAPDHLQSDCLLNESQYGVVEDNYVRQ